MVGLHDPTEGGLLSAVFELCYRANCGVVLELDAVPVYPETREICTRLGLDPFSLLASGALLVAARPDSHDQLVSAFEAARTPLCCIGTFLGKEEGLTIASGQGRRTLITPGRDELARAYELLA